MPHTFTSEVTGGVFGQSYSVNQNQLFDMGTPHAPSVAAASDGTLTVRTDNDTGSLTMESGHGITTASKLDVYWDNGDGTFGSRARMTVGTVASLVVPIDGGVGDNLPAAATVITAKVPNVETGLALTAGGVMVVAFRAPEYACCVTLAEADGTPIVTIRLDPNESYVWTAASGIASPVAEDVGQIWSSHQSPDVSAVVNGVLGYN